MAGSATITGTQHYVLGIGHPKTDALNEAAPAVWNVAQTALVNPVTGADVILGGAASRIDAIASTKMPTWATGTTTLKFFQERLYEILQEDTDTVIFGFTNTYGFQETLSSGSMSIDISVDNPDGTRVRGYFDNNTVGTVPTTGTDQTGTVPAAVGSAGLLFTVPIRLTAKLKRGSKLWYNMKVVQNGAGNNGHLRNAKQFLPNQEERVEIVGSAGPAPTDRTMSGVPANGYTPFCVRPILILGTTTRNVVVQYGDSINADDQSWPQITDGTGYTGITNRYLANRVATINLSQSSESYTNLNVGNRFALRQYIGQNFGSVIFDQLGVNESPASTKAQYLAFFTAFKARFAGLGKAYGHSSLLPRATTTDNWTTTTNQTVVAPNAADTNEALRALNVVDFYVDINAAVESSRGSSKWKPSPVSIGNVSVANGTDPFANKLLTSATPIFTPDLIGATVGVSASGTTLSVAQIWTVAADALSCQTAGMLSGNTGSIACFLRPYNFDQLHPTIESELAVEQSTATWAQMSKYLT